MEKELMDAVKSNSEKISTINACLEGIGKDISWIREGIKDIKQEHSAKLGELDGRVNKLEDNQRGQKWFDDLGQNIVQFIVMLIVTAIVGLIIIKT